MKKPFSDAVIRSGGQSIEAPADWRVVLHMDLTLAGAQGSTSHLNGLWMALGVPQSQAGVRDIVSLKDEKAVKHHDSIFLEWHCC